MEENYFGFAKCFESCTALKELLLVFTYPEFELAELYIDEVAARLPSDVNGVKHFELPFLKLVESYKLSCVLCLMRSFPFLEYLEIQVENEVDVGSIESLELEGFLDATFNHLRVVRLEHFGGTSHEMQLVRLFFGKVIVLECIVIDTRLSEDEFLDVDAFTELSQFWRASPKAEIVDLSRSVVEIH